MIDAGTYSVEPGDFASKLLEKYNAWCKRQTREVFEVASLVEELVTVLEEEEKIYQTLISLWRNKDRHPDSGRCSGTGKTDMSGTAGKWWSGDTQQPAGTALKGYCQCTRTYRRKRWQLPDWSLCWSRSRMYRKNWPKARDRLLAAADRMNHLNDQNVALIKQAIELNEFDLTLFKSLRQAPWDRQLWQKLPGNTGSLLGSSGFDAMS